MTLLFVEINGTGVESVAQASQASWRDLLQIGKTLGEKLGGTVLVVIMVVTGCQPECQLNQFGLFRIAERVILKLLFQLAKRILSVPNRGIGGVGAFAVGTLARQRCSQALDHLALTGAGCSLFRLCLEDFRLTHLAG